MRRGEIKPWTPSIGMRIQYRYWRADNGDTVPIAEVLKIDERKSIQIRHETGGRRTVWLREETWLGRWEPVPVETPPQPTQPAFTFPLPMTEADVRRIVREELQRAFASA